ncbi:MAG: tetratricopeptide repeat protein [Gammaproteobacteria bacterium]|nr:tetratricopeptide repeat protein [Gammaproteobacteria bacterium]
MSLINKVLRDLEAQRDTISERKARSPLTQDSLRPVRSIKPRLSRQQLLRIGLAVATVAVGVFAWNQWGAKLLTGGKPPPAVVPAPEPAKVAAAPAPPVAPRPAPIATVEPPKPVVPAENVKPVAPVVPTGKSAQDVVVRKPKVESSTSKKPAAPVTEPPARTVVAEVKEPAPDEATVKDEAGAKSAIKPNEEVPQPDDSRDGRGRTVLEKKVKPLSPQDKAESQYRLAATSLQQNRVSEAENQLRTALAAQPTHVKARELLAGLALQSGRWREAQALLEQGIAQHPQHYPFAQLLARSYIDHGQESKALHLLEKSRDAAGTDAEYFAFLATLYQRNSRHGEAVKSFSEAVKLRPQEGRWWLGFAISLEATEQWKASSEAYQRAITSGSLDKQLLQYSQQRLAAVKNK